jgi:hypothetical protein
MFGIRFFNDPDCPTLVVKQATSKTTKVSAPDEAVLLQLFVLLFLLYSLFILNFIEILRACRASQSTPVFPVRMQRLERRSAQRGRISSEADPGPTSRHTEPSPSRVASELMNVRSCRTLDSRRINF